MEISNKELLEIANQFSLNGEILEIIPFGNGHINKTYKLVTENKNYVLQRINTYVFPNVDDLMNNIVRVTEHLKNKGLESLTLRPTFKGNLYVRYGDEFYRVYDLIEDTNCYEGIDNLETIRKSGYAFGQLHCNLSDLNPENIVDVIPDFHNTGKRYEKFLKAVSKDPLNRVSSVKELINFINSHREDYSLLINSVNDGSINNAITHNDPKTNNILFDKATDEVKCVIDLDTVMTGTYLFDFGDALRSLFTGENEDSKDLSLLKVNFDIYEAYLNGYYSQMKNVLNKKEISLLPKAVAIITMELCIRFLTDYIEGDIYFGISYPEHNLDRAMTQYTLAKDIYNNLDKLNELTERICR